MLAATNKGFVYRLRISDFSNVLLSENHTLPVVSVSYLSGQSERFITCSKDGTMRLWDANDYSVRARFVSNQKGLENIHALCA